MTRFLPPAALFTLALALALFSLPASAQPGPHDYGPGPGPLPHRRLPPPAVVIVEPAPVLPVQPAPVVVIPAASAAQTAQPYCREYQTTTMVGGELKPSYGTACQQPDGSWKIVATRP
jgi:hypothetical protein